MLGPTLDSLKQEQSGKSTFRIAEDQVFIMYFNARSDHSVSKAGGWRFELHEIGFAGHHGNDNTESSGEHDL